MTTCLRPKREMYICLCIAPPRHLCVPQPLKGAVVTQRLQACLQIRGHDSVRIQPAVPSREVS